MKTQTHTPWLDSLSRSRLTNSCLGQGWSYFPQIPPSFFALSGSVTIFGQGCNDRLRYRKLLPCVLGPQNSRQAPRIEEFKAFADRFQGGYASQEVLPNGKQRYSAPFVEISQPHEPECRDSEGIDQAPSSDPTAAETSETFGRGQPFTRQLVRLLQAYPKNKICPPSAGMSLRQQHILAQSGKIRPSLILKAFWDSVLILEENAKFYEPTYLEVAL